jgi:nucleoside-diphosphate-sugar epimerase
MKTVMVTGATGLIGAMICERLIRQGDKVRALARKPDSADAIALKGMGVEIVPGDVSDLADVRKATAGTDGVIHSAALRGLPGATIANSLPPNLIGTMNVLTAAAEAGLPVVQVLTSTFFAASDKPLSETSPLDLVCQNVDPYSLTKRWAFAEGFTRVASGQDIRFMLPGAGYGPTPCLENAMFSPSFNDRIAKAIRGELAPQMPMKTPYVLADDCAYVCIAALERGVKGERYIAMGRSGDVDTLANICNHACKIAGVSHRVEEVPRERLDDPDVVAKYGATMTSLGKRRQPDPMFDSSFTEQRLGYVPTPLEDGLKLTIDWMREHRFI